MKLLAKPILENKFWIVEGVDGSKRGTVQSTPNGSARVVLDNITYEFDSFQAALNELSIQQSSTEKPSKEYADCSVEGYPTKDIPYNIVVDAKMQLPMYTKTEKSRCYYAAGYYIIRFEFAWAQAYCPKVMTLKRNQYQGPYKTELEMKEQLRINNGKS